MSGPKSKLYGLAIAVADGACRADIECYAHVERVDEKDVYDITRAQSGGKTTPEEEDDAVQIAQRAAAYIDLRGDVFPWRLVHRAEAEHLFYFMPKAVRA